MTTPTDGVVAHTLHELEICALIPHRAPFLFIQRVEITSPKTARAIACWPEGSPFFLGHFPRTPIVPGVYLVEAAAQAAGVLLMHRFKQEGVGVETPLGVLGGIRRFVIHEPTFPDQEIEIDVTLSSRLTRLFVVEAAGRRADARVFSAQLVVAGV